MNKKLSSDEATDWSEVIGEGMIPLSEATTFLLQAVARRLRHGLTKELQHHDLTVTEWFALRALNEKISLTINELTGLAHRSQPTMSRAVDSLYRKQLVTKHGNAKDKRVVELRLTKKGKTLFTKDILPGTWKNIQSKVTVSEYAELRRILKKFLA